MQDLNSRQQCNQVDFIACSIVSYKYACFINNSILQLNSFNPHII